MLLVRLLVAQTGQRVTDVRLDGSYGDAESRSRVGLGEVVEVAQHKHRALPRRQPAQVLEQRDTVVAVGAVGAVLMHRLRDHVGGYLSPTAIAPSVHRPQRLIRLTDATALR